MKKPLTKLAPPKVDVFTKVLVGIFVAGAAAMVVLSAATTTGTGVDSTPQPIGTCVFYAGLSMATKSNITEKTCKDNKYWLLWCPNATSCTCATGEKSVFLQDKIDNRDKYIELLNNGNKTDGYIYTSTELKLTLDDFYFLLFKGLQENMRDCVCDIIPSDNFTRYTNQKIFSPDGRSTITSDLIEGLIQGDRKTKGTPAFIQEVTKRISRAKVPLNNCYPLPNNCKFGSSYRVGSGTSAHNSGLALDIFCWGDAKIGAGCADPSGQIQSLIYMFSGEFNVIRECTYLERSDACGRTEGTQPTVHIDLSDRTGKTGNKTPCMYLNCDQNKTGICP